MNKLVLSTIAAACLSSTAAFAALPATGVTNGVIVGLQGGYAAIQTPSNKQFAAQLPGSTSYETDIGNFSYGGYVGYLFAANPNILVGPTLGYNWFGYSRYKAFGETLKIKSQAASLLAKGLYVFNNGVDINAAVGAAYVTQKYTGSAMAGSSLTGHAYRPEFGIGAGYEFANGLGLNGGFTYITGKTSSHFVKQPYAVGALNADVSYKFN